MKPLKQFGNLGQTVNQNTDIEVRDCEKKPFKNYLLCFAFVSSLVLVIDATKVGHNHRHR